jgi:hypothetical protein
VAQPSLGVAGWGVTPHERLSERTHNACCHAGLCQAFSSTIVRRHPPSQPSPTRGKGLVERFRSDMRLPAPRSDRRMAFHSPALVPFSRLASRPRRRRARSPHLRDPGPAPRAPNDPAPRRPAGRLPPKAGALFAESVLRDPRFVYPPFPKTCCCSLLFTTLEKHPLATPVPCLMEGSFVPIGIDLHVERSTDAASACSAGLEINVHLRSVLFSHARWCDLSIAAKRSGILFAVPLGTGAAPLGAGRDSDGSLHGPARRNAQRTCRCRTEAKRRFATLERARPNRTARSGGGTSPLNRRRRG